MSLRQCKHCSIQLKENFKGWVCKSCKNGLDRYNLNRLQQIQLLESQGNKCALCENAVALHIGKHKSACIDHDHKSGKVRGVLCSYCNVALGRIENSAHHVDPATFLKNIESYLGN